MKTEIMINNSDVLSALCKAKGKWGMFLSIPEASQKEVLKAAPYLQADHFVSLAVVGHGFIFMDSKEELYGLYHQTVGDDGPTLENPYDGPCRIYALTCNPEGKLQTENT